MSAVRRSGAGVVQCAAADHVLQVQRKERSITSHSSTSHAASAPTPPEAAVLAAVAEPARIRLLQLLLDGERCVTQCVEHTGLGQSLVSKHLGRLVEAGLVERRRVGRRNYHSVVDPQALDELLEVAGRLAKPVRTSSPGA